MIGKQIQSVRSTHSHDSQKQLQSAKVIEQFEQIPEVYQQFFKPHLSRGESLPYTILTSTYETSSETITGKLVCAIDHAFYVLEEKENRLVTVCYPIDEINYVEIIHQPLALHFKVNGLTNLGIPSTSVFGCSPSTDYIFAPLMQRIRLRIVSLNEKAPSRHLEKLDRWKDLNSQVIDMARHCLMAGETVIESILQPEIRSSIFEPDRVVRGVKCAAHIYILTDKELVMIREDPTRGKKDKRGNICTFVPISKINSLTLTRENDNQLVVSIRISNGDVYESLFNISLAKDVNRFVDRTRELMPKERAYRRD
jgi:hypothetical protein